MPDQKACRARRADACSLSLCEPPLFKSQLDLLSPLLSELSNSTTIRLSKLFLFYCLNTTLGQQSDCRPRGRVAPPDARSGCDYLFKILVYENE